ncbi:MAG TPA: histidine kinase [Chitinophagaceae bacterium]|jgi:hypothetical protein|nr:histidine kinase [Chitinophagaceae bacterium]
MQDKQRLNDTWFRFAGIPFIGFMSHVIFYNEHQGVTDEKYSSWQIILISIGEAMVLWEANRLVLAYFRRRFPGLHESGKRIACQFAGCMFVTIVIRYLNLWIYSKTLFWGYAFNADAYLYNIFVALLYVVIVAGIYEGIYYFQKWKLLFYETELLKRENLQTQLDSLKTQINPHFLFNNLSSLASLIMEDQRLAVTFVKELSSVYRYLLQANEKNLATLDKELGFINNYYHLLHTRFGDGIELSTTVDEKYLSHLLPPLTLQILVENAVKHNAILPERPLRIRILTDENGNLAVVNNLQKKTSPVISHKLGLRNIQSKYKLLMSGEVVVQQTTDAFTVIVPLIKKAPYENVDN